MWNNFSNIILTLVMLIVLTYIIQWLVPSTRGHRGVARASVRRDIGPIMGFFGLLLLALSFLQAAERGATLAWGVGAAFGLVMTLGLWLGVLYWASLPPPPPQGRVSPLRTAIRIVRTYGLVFLVGLSGLGLATRILGPASQVFISGAMGVLVVGAAAAVFTRAASHP